MGLMFIILIFYVYDSEKIMKTSDVGVEMIKEFEGKKQVAYQDPAGVWTIGYGHTKGVEKGQLVIKKTCDKFLEEDLDEFEGYVDSYVKVPLTQNQFDALVAWTFNLGPTNLNESTMLRKLNYGDYESVPDEMRRWNKAGGEVLNGLVRRRDAEANLFSS
jgi:lysozyme